MICLKTRTQYAVIIIWPINGLSAVLGVHLEQPKERLSAADVRHTSLNSAAH